MYVYKDMETHLTYVNTYKCKIYTYLCIYVLVNFYSYRCIHVYMYTCVYICILICMYIYTYMYEIIIHVYA